MERAAIGVNHISVTVSDELRRVLEASAVAQGRPLANMACKVLGDWARGLVSRDHGANTRGRHQAPAHLIIPDGGRQAAMQDVDLLPKDPPDNKQRFDLCRQVGKVLDQLFDARFKPHIPNHASRPKLRNLVRRSFSIAIAFDCKNLRWVSSIRGF